MASLGPLENLLNPSVAFVLDFGWGFNGVSLVETYSGGLRAP